MEVEKSTVKNQQKKFLKKLKKSVNLAKIIDHTNLKANATKNDIRQLCQEAKKYGFRAVCINPRWVKLAKEELKGTDIKVAPAVDWPCGASSTEVRVFATKKAKDDGADEIDIVLDIGNFKIGKYKEVLEDLKKVAEILPTKVIVETGFLTEEEIIKATQLVKESGAFCVKTSTSLEPKVDIDTKISHVKLMRRVVGKGFLIKAAGGIRTVEDAQRMIKAGADIIGTSSGVEIVKELMFKTRR